jgi:hypothetical protein
MFQVACLHDRDQASHDALGVEMLHQGIIGTEPSSHPEIEAFKNGFRLPCRNGFDFFDVCYIPLDSHLRPIPIRNNKVIKSWNGGSEDFLKLAARSHITSYADLRDHLMITSTTATLERQLERQLQQALADSSMSFSTLVINFLKGKGIPCKQRFADARIHFNDIINLDAVEEEGFRAKIFCWAVTGSYALEPNAAPISVCFLLFNNDTLVCLIQFCRFSSLTTTSPLTQQLIFRQPCFAKGHFVSEPASGGF